MLKKQVPPALQPYLDDCRARGLNPKTVELYARYLAVLERQPLPTRRERLLQTLDEFPNARTRHIIFRAARAWSLWMERNGGEAFASGVNVRCPRAVRGIPLSRDEFETIIEAMPRSTWPGMRDRALYSLIYYSAMRRDAARTLELDRLDLDARRAVIVTKGGKEQVCAIPKPAAVRIAEWLRCNPSARWVFPSSRGDAPICANQVTHRLPKYATAAGIKRRVFVHLLRHSAATAMRQAGESLDVIQDALGHASPDTTRIYARIGTDDVARAMDRVFS